MSFTDWPWRHWCAQFTDTPALRLNDEVLSWQQLCARIDSLAAGFHRQGVEEGDGVLLLAALLVEDARPAAGTAAAALVLAALGVLNLADGFTMPRYSAEWDAAVQQIEAALTESRSAVTSADPWDSTVAYAFGDPVHCGLLYGVLDGMGIQFDEAAYLTDPAHEIHSRYVLTAADTPTAARLQADGWTVLYESDRGVLYEHGTM